MEPSSSGPQHDERKRWSKTTANREKSEETKGIRRDMHDAVTKGDIDHVQKCLNQEKDIRQWLHPSTEESAMYTAVKMRQYKIYALLVSRNCRLSQDKEEEEGEYFVGVNPLGHLEIEYQLHSFLHRCPTVARLIGKSSSKGPHHGFEKKVEELYQKLEKTPIVNTILQVVATSAFIEIVFDFDNENLCCMLGYGRKQTLGLCLLKPERIYIAAKMDDADLLGTLAHELCHAALQLVYKNLGKPYKANDTGARDSYKRILSEIKSNKSTVHKIIQLAFQDWSPEEEELIVRIPHMLAMCAVGQDINKATSASEQETSMGKLLQEQVPQLRHFFEEVIKPDMEGFLKRSRPQKDREEIEKQNLRLGEVTRIRELRIKFKTNYVLQDLPLQVLVAHDLTFLEVMVNDAARSTGESYVLFRTAQWDSELRDALHHNKCHYVILSSAKEVETKEPINEEMLDYMYGLSVERNTKVVVLTEDAEHCQLVTTLREQRYFKNDVHVTRVSNAGLDNVTDECKARILQLPLIRFQGKMKLKKSELLYFSDAEQLTQILDEATFLTLCQGKEIHVGRVVVPLDESVANCYVGRTCKRMTTVDLFAALRARENEAFAIVGCEDTETLSALVRISFDIRHHSRVDQFCKCLLLDTVSDYDAITQRPFYKGKAVHLLKYCSKSRKLRWIKSNGPVSHLPMVDDGACEILNEESLRGITAEKVVGICGAPGMGKSLLSLSIAQAIKSGEKNWVLHVNLMGKRGFLNLSTSLDDSHHAIEQLAKMCEVEEGTFELRLLVESMQNARPFKVFVIFDAIDEVDVECRQFIMKLALALSATRISKLFLFSRTLCKSEIEDTFHIVAFELNGFDEQQQLGFLVNYWKRNNREMDVAKLDSFARRTLSRFRAWEKYSITENPLLIKMIAEIDEEQLNQVEHGEPDDKAALIGAKCRFLDVYEKFVANKFRIYREKQFGKRGSNESGLAVQYDVAVLEHDFYETYGILALKAILHHDLIVKLLEKRALHELEKCQRLMKDVEQGRLRHGFLDERSVETPVFLHKTFAEFFAAHFLARKINSATSTDDVMYDIVAHMYGSEEYSGVLDFFDAMGTKPDILHRYIMDNDSESAKNVIRQRSLDGLGRTPLHIAALHADKETLNIIRSELGDKLTEELQVKDILGMTPLMYIDRIRAWDRLDVLCAGCSDQNIRLLELLPAVNGIITKERRFKHSVFAEAVIMECSELLDCFGKAWYSRRNIEEYSARERQNRVRRRCSEKPTPVDANVIEMPINISGALLRCSDIRAVSASGLSVCHMSAALGLVDTCRYLTFRLPVDARDRDGETPLHEAAIYGHPNVVHILLPHSSSRNVTDKKKSTPLHTISKFRGLFILRTLYLRALDHTRNMRWWTSSHETALEGHDVVLSSILPHVDGAIRNCGGGTALHESANNLFWRSIVLLLPYSDVDAVNDTRETPMLGSVSYNSLLRRTTSLFEDIFESGRAAESRSIASMKLLILHSDVKVADRVGSTALHRCTSLGHLDAVKLLLCISSVTTVDKNGMSSLYCAAESGNVDALKFLLPLSSVNARDVQYRTPLHVSASCGHTDITSLLLLFTSTEIRVEEQPTLLDYCTWNGHTNVVRYLLPHLSTTIRSIHGNTSLHISADIGHLEVARVILPHTVHLVHATYDCTAAHMAAYYNSYKVLKLLLPYFEADNKDNFGDTALMLKLKVCFQRFCTQEKSDKKSSNRSDMLGVDDIEMIKLLLLHSDVNIANKDGYTALHVSALGHVDFLKLLLPVSSVCAVDKNGMSSLHHVAEESIVGSLKFLLHFSFVNSRDVNGKTPIYASAYHGHVDVTRHLLLFTSTESRESGSNPLYGCTYNGQSGVVEYLLPHSSRTVTVSEGVTTLHVSAFKGHLEVARAILPHSDPVMRDNGGNAVLFTGVYHGACKVVNLLLPYSELDTKNNSGNTVLMSSLRGYINRFTSEGESDPRRREMLGTDDIEMIKLLLLHSDVNIANKDGCTALHISTLGHVDVLKLLLPLSPVSAGDKTGMSSLHHAAEKSIIGCLKFLPHFSSANSRDVNGKTPIYASAYPGHVDIARHLLLFTSTESHESGSDLLHAFTDNGQCDVVKYLLPHSSRTVTLSEGVTTLHLSAPKGHLEVARVILPHSDPVMRDSGGNAVLFTGVYHGACKVVNLLLPYSELDIENNSGDTVLVYSLLGYIKRFNSQGESDPRRREMLGTDDIQMIKLLLLHLDVNTPGSNGFTGLHVSTLMRDRGAIKLILPFSAVSTVDKSGRSLLHCAAQSGNVDSFKLLLPSSSVNARDAEGQTALRVSACHGNIDVTTVLLPLVSISVRDKCNQTPLHACTFKGHTRIAHLLVPHSSTTKPGIDGCNPLHISARLGYVDIVRLILPHTDALIRDGHGYPALHGGALGRCADGVKLLLPYSEPEMTDHSGGTALLDYLLACFIKRKTEQESTADGTEKSLVPEEDDVRMIKMLVLHSAVPMAADDATTTLHMSRYHLPLDCSHDVVPSNQEDASGETILRYVVLRDKLDAAQIVILDSHKPGCDGELPLKEDTFMGAVSTLRFARRLTLTSDACKYILLYHCVFERDARMTELVLQHSSTSANNRSGCTALELPVNIGREQIVRVILPHSDVMFRNYNGETALHIAAHKQCYDVVTLLLPYSEVDVVDKFGETVVVRSLRGYGLWFERGAENTTESWRKSEVMGKEHIRMLSIRLMKLLMLHSDLDIVDEDERTALQVCVSLGLLDATKLLLPHFDSSFPRLQPCDDEVTKLLSRWPDMH